MDAARRRPPSRPRRGPPPGGRGQVSRLLRSSVRWSAGIVLAVLLGAFVVPLGCGQGQKPPPPAPAAPVVRVRVMQDVTGARLVASAAAKPVVVRAAGGRAARLALPVNALVPVTLTPTGWQVGTAALGGTGDLTLEADPEGSVGVADASANKPSDARPYRGSLRFVPSGKTAAADALPFHVVNHVLVDDYLKGVLAAELYPDFAPEAYKALAIAARTYALYTARTAADGRQWDLVSDTRSQMYGGVRSETAKAAAAAAETAGVVLAFGPAGEERIFKAYYSSCCGGATQTALEGLADPTPGPFVARSVGRRCDVAAGRYHAKFDWPAVVVSREELARRFKAWGPKNGVPALRNLTGVKKLEVARRNAAGRPVQFVVEDARGLRVLLGSEQLRVAVNHDAPEKEKLPSSFVTPVTEGPNVRFADGHGFGHGVGLCQWCIEAEARQGLSHEAIVRDAYPGAVLVKGY